MLNHMYDDVADGINLGKNGKKLTFEDIDTRAYAGTDFMPDGYAGLTWSPQWLVADPAEWDQTSPYTNSGWYSGITSGEQIAWNNSGTPLEISARSFNIQSFELTAAWDKKMSVEIVAYRHGEVVYDQTFFVSTAGPTLIELNLERIDNLFLTPTEIKVDKDAGGGYGAIMIIDDMIVSRVRSLPTPPEEGHHGGDPIVNSHAFGGHQLMHPDMGHVVALA